MIFNNKEVENIIINNKTVSTIHLNDELIYPNDVTYTLSLYFKDPNNSEVPISQFSGTVNSDSISRANFKHVNDHWVIDLHAGDLYDITFSYVLTGYEPSPSRIQGTMPNNDDSCTVIFEQQTYTLTLRYVYENGTGAVNDIDISGTVAGQNVTKSSFTQTSDRLSIQCAYGASYSVTCIPPTGYTADSPTQSGTMSAGPTGRTTILVSNQGPIIDLDPIL